MSNHPGEAKARRISSETSCSQIVPSKSTTTARTGTKPLTPRGFTMIDPVLRQGADRKQRKWCSEACRVAYNRARREPTRAVCF